MGARGSISRFYRIALLALYVLAAPLLLNGAQPSAAQSHQLREYDVKAAYLFNFARFAQWPPTASHQDFTICVMGADPFRGALEAIVSGEQINGEKVFVKHVETVHEASGCKILFISRSEADRYRLVLGSLAGSPVLTVSDLPEFTASGGMIQFLLQEERVKFEVNLGAAQKARLTLSSQLLKVATRVLGGNRGGE